MSMIDDILERFGVPRATTSHAVPPPVVYKIGTAGWGDAIEWRGERLRVMGWKKRIPQVGDLLHAPMVSGRMGVYRFTKVRREFDPPDMFFGDVEFVGYEGPS